MPLVLAGATSGQATVQATDAQTVTITMPATSGTLAVGGTTPTFTTLTVTGDASISGLTVGKGLGSQSSNTAIGNGALGSNSSGNTSSAFGFYSLISNTTGSSNSSYGYTAMQTNTTGSSNVAFGHSALFSNTTASNNTAVGFQAGYSNTTGSNVTAFGYQAAYTSNNGTVTAIGQQSLYSNTSGFDLTALGYQALNKNTTGAQSVGLGFQALYNNTTANNNTAVGYQAGYSTTTGYGNTCIGFKAGTLSTGLANTYIGSYATANGGGSTGKGNSTLGYQAGYNLTTGSRNTFIGGSDDSTNYAAGYFVTTGNNNTIIGAYSGNQGGLDIRTASNYIVLSDGDGNPRTWIDNSGNLMSNQTGNYQSTISKGITVVSGAYADNTTKANIALIGGVGDNGNRCGWTAYSIKTGGAGNGSQYYIRPVTWSGTAFAEQTSAGVYLADNATSWTSASDERLKNIIEPITNGAEKVSQLRAVIGKYKTDEETTRRPFLIAQDVQKVLPEAVDSSNPDELGVAYTDVIPLLVAAIQELNAKVTALEEQIINLGVK
jgi:trimeric autotransporter adhesin